MFTTAILVTTGAAVPEAAGDAAAACASTAGEKTVLRPKPRVRIWIFAMFIAFRAPSNRYLSCATASSESLHPRPEAGWRPRTDAEDWLRAWLRGPQPGLQHYRHPPAPW